MVDREIFSRRLEALHGYVNRLRAFRDVEEAEFVREPALHHLAERRRGWAGFRNTLVHEYLAIDHAIAYRPIRDELDDLSALAEGGGHV